MLALWSFCPLCLMSRTCLPPFPEEIILIGLLAGSAAPRLIRTYRGRFVHHLALCLFGPARQAFSSHQRKVHSPESDRMRSPGALCLPAPEPPHAGGGGGTGKIGASVNRCPCAELQRDKGAPVNVRLPWSMPRTLWQQWKGREGGAPRYLGRNIKRALENSKHGISA